MKAESLKWQDAVAALETDVEAMSRERTALQRELEAERATHKMTKERLAALEKDHVAHSTSSSEKSRELESQIRDLQSFNKANLETIKSRDLAITQLKLQNSSIEIKSAEASAARMSMARQLESLAEEKKAQDTLLLAAKNEKSSMERGALVGVYFAGTADTSRRLAATEI